MNNGFLLYRRDRNSSFAVALWQQQSISGNEISYLLRPHWSIAGNERTYLLRLCGRTTTALENLEQPNSRESFFVNNKEKAPDSLSIEILGAVRRQFRAQG